MAKLKRKILNIVLILFLGALGGILAQGLVSPYLARSNLFSALPLIGRGFERTTIINKSEEIIITENQAVSQAVDKIKPALMAIEVYQNKRLIKKGTGWLMTGDGLVITSADLALDQGAQIHLLQQDNFFIAQVVKKDPINHLALLQIEGDNLPVVSLADLAGLRLGEEVILVAMSAEDEQLSLLVNIGTVRSIKDQSLLLNLEEKSQWANGSPLVNVKGEVIGLNLVDQKGLARAVPVNKIKKFISPQGLVL